MKKLALPAWRVRSSVFGSYGIALLAWTLALGVVAWVLAVSVWGLIAPGKVLFPYVDVIDPDVAAGKVAALHLFGEQVVRRRHGQGQIRLDAVIAGVQGRQGYAVISVDGGRAQGKAYGEEVAKGVVLSRISFDRVELDSAQGTQVVELATAGSRPAGDPSGLSAVSREKNSAER